MKVIFLDINGVLVTRSFWNQLKLENKKARGDDHYHLFDPTCVRNLEKLIEETGAKLVISSTWRYIGILKLRNLFKDRKISGEIIGLTTTERFEDSSSIYSGESRGRQIQEYLDTHPEIENYVIIDDDADMMDCQLENFVNTKFDTGFNDEAFEKALKILKKRNEKEKLV